MCFWLCRNLSNNTGWSGLKINASFDFQGYKYIMVVALSGKSWCLPLLQLTVGHISMNVCSVILTEPTDIRYLLAIVCVFLKPVYFNNLLIWLYVLIMSSTHFRVNPHSIAAWMSRNSLLETGVKSEV